MTTYVYGIIISVIMIAAGLSGQFSGGGTGINIPLVAVGAIFLVIDVTMLLQARRGQQQASQVGKPRSANSEVKQIEANAEVLASDQPQEAVAEAVTAASTETVTAPSTETATAAPAEMAPGTLMEIPTELSIEEAAQSPIEDSAELLAEEATQPPIEDSAELLVEETTEPPITNPES